MRASRAFDALHIKLKYDPTPCRGCNGPAHLGSTLERKRGCLCVHTGRSRCWTPTWWASRRFAPRPRVPVRRWRWSKRSSSGWSTTCSARSLSARGREVVQRLRSRTVSIIGSPGLQPLRGGHVSTDRRARQHRSADAGGVVVGGVVEGEGGGGRVGGGGATLCGEGPARPSSDPHLTLISPSSHLHLFLISPSSHPHLTLSKSHLTLISPASHPHHLTLI